MNPIVKCDKCGFEVDVTRFRYSEFPPDAAKKNFRKVHRDCGEPVYFAGVGFRGRAEGQDA